MRCAALSSWTLLTIGCAPLDEGVGASREPLRDLDAVEREFLRLLNEYRVANGVEPVRDDRALNDGARVYSERMGREDFFDHVAPDGSTFTERMCEAGYEPACGPRTAVGENIAAGQWTAREVFEAWRRSPGHDRNMRAREFRVVGIGRAVVSGSRFEVYWTSTFAGTVVATTNPLDAGAAAPDAGREPPADGGRPPSGRDASGPDAADDEPDTSVPTPGEDAGRERSGRGRRGGCYCASPGLARWMGASGSITPVLGAALTALVVRRVRRASSRGSS
ncbi:MAG: CAP domain-containing protein [Myxococcota bacterium]|nr:CAP domain-containing protein [Myxococcota bacterium]